MLPGLAGGSLICVHSRGRGHPIRPGTAGVAALVVLALVGVRPVFGQPSPALPPAAPAAPGPVASTPVPEAPLPLSAGFSPLERVSALTAASAGLFLLIAGDTVFDPPSPSMGPPDPDSLDARISRRLYRPDKGRLWYRVPDVGGNYVLPVLPALFYGIDTIALLQTGQPWLRTSDLNPHYRLMAYVEAMGWTYLITGAVKYLVGRPRPYSVRALDRPQLAGPAREENLSFYSAHAAATFAVGAFVTEDVSRALRRGPLATASPTRRFLLGGLLPAVVGYGIPAVVALSRVIDQQHWTTDVVAGAAVGALVANLTYAAHFDDAGRPLLRDRTSPRTSVLTAARVTVVPNLPGAGPGLVVAGRF